MPKLARVGDKSAEEETDNGTWQEAPALGPGSETVFCNGMKILLLGDKVGTRKCIKLEPVMDEETGEPVIDEETGEPKYKEVTTGTQTDIVVEEASSTVFVEGVPVAREGDKLTHGNLGSGSDNVYAN